MYVEMRKYMKKKLFSVLLVGALAASLVACGKTEKKEAKASTANTEINAEEYAGTITSNAGVYKTFVNLSDWKGMSVDLKESDYVVLDSDVDLNFFEFVFYFFLLFFDFSAFDFIFLAYV